MKILISLHNGIGDLIITFPILKHLLSLGYDITYETVDYNFGLVEYFFGDNVKLIEYKNHEDPVKKHIKKSSDDQLYDFVVNLNNLYKLNYISHYYYKDDHAKQLNRQILLSFLFVNAYVTDIPKDLNLSSRFAIQKYPNNNILVFTQSRSAENRKIHYDLVCQLKEHYKLNSSILFDPKYDSLKDLCENINNAKLVITVDTGTLHIAEILKTNWIGLFTNLGEHVLTKYYNYGKQIVQSNVGCSPCNYHGGACQRNVDNQFNCIYGFDFQSIVNIIDKNL